MRKIATKYDKKAQFIKIELFVTIKVGFCV